MTLSRRKEAAERDAKMVEYLAAQKAGVTVYEAAKHLWCSDKAARLSLYRLMYRGEAVYVSEVSNGFGHWARPELKQVVLAAREEFRAEMKCRRKEHDNRPRNIAVEPEETVDPPIVHRLVAANEAPPLHTRGVPSVFHLGYAA